MSLLLSCTFLTTSPQDLEICREEGHAVGMNRALGNVGRVYARMNQMEKV